MEKKYLLVDGNALIFRAFYSSFNRSNLTTKSGIPTNAVYSFINMLMNIYEKENYFSIKVAFDKGKKTFRHEKHEEYKKGRAKTPSELIQQFPIVKEFLTCANIEWFELDSYEADDIIGTMSKLLESKKDSITHILSSDQDMYQLITEKTFVLAPQTGTSDLVIYDKDKLFEKLGINPEQVTDYKGLRGDNSDNIKGVAGIGEKTAKELLQQFGSLENIYENIEKIKGSRKENLIKGQKDAFFSKEIATIYKDLKIDDLNFDETKINFVKLKDFFIKYEMNSLIKKYFSKFSEKYSKAKIDYETLDKWNASYNEKENYIYLETLDENYHDSDVIGVAISNAKGNFYFNINNTQEINIFNWNEKHIDNEFQEFLLNNKFKTYNLKKTIISLKILGYEINCDLFEYDMMIACYILNPNIKSLIENHILMLDPQNDIESFDDIFGKGIKKTKYINENIKKEYLIKKSFSIKHFEKTILNKLAENNQTILYEKIELPFSKILLDMEWQGIYVDKKELNIQQKNTLNYLNNIELEIKNDLSNYIEQDFNLASPKQLKELLYNKLKLPNLKKGSTDKEVLELIEYKHPIVSKILKYRKYSKLYSTYLKGFEKYIHKDNKIHTIFNQTLTSTGRLSSSYPNIQNISIKDEDQKSFRKIFVANKDNIYISFDYSQIELRVLADMANEKKLLKIFSMKRDIHSEAAKNIFNLDENQSVTFDQRRTAKTFNFGILYGLGALGLANDLKISIKEAKQHINDYYKAFPEILKFKDEMIDFAYKYGYVKTISNRRRYIRELENSSLINKEFGKRIAVNTPIQGTASDILKVAMINVYKNLKENNLKSKMVAQIHDEIIMLVDNNEIDIVKNLVIQIMKDSYNDLLKLSKENRKALVELEVNHSQANNWFDLK